MPQSRYQCRVDTFNPLRSQNLDDDEEYIAYIHSARYAPVNYITGLKVKNITHDDEPPFRISDFNQNGSWDPNESISIRPYAAVADGPLISIRFNQDSLAVSDTTIYDTTYTGSDTVYSDTTIYDTTHLEVIDPVVGDIFHIEIDRPFSKSDVFSFTSVASKIDTKIAHDQLDSIAVVPNPYIVTASWESRHQYQSGRGPRKIDFINLPSECTIKIFTLSGYLVATIDHKERNENGSESWNLLSRDNLEIAYGIYLYHIDAPGIGETTGKFAVVK